MTIEKDRVIKIPIWLVSIVLPAIIALITAFGMLTSAKTELELRANRNEAEIEKLRKEKVSKDELTLVLDKLNSIDQKLDRHIERK